MEATVIPPATVRIPAGTFVMGSDPRREQPQHTLALDAYAIGRTPVTNAEYAVFVRATGHRAPAHWTAGAPPEGLAQHPVVYVAWHDARAYCRWLARITQEPYRLPTEAEWERAARGDDGRLYPWGDAWDAGRCNTLERGRGATSAVGHDAGDVSPWGALELAGNVAEWTASLWGDDPYTASFGYPYDPHDGREETDAGESVYRIFRGGAFNLHRAHARCASRHRDLPDSSIASRGFRVAKTWSTD